MNPMTSKDRMKPDWVRISVWTVCLTAVAVFWWAAWKAVR